MNGWMDEPCTESKTKQSADRIGYSMRACMHFYGRCTALSVCVAVFYAKPGDGIYFIHEINDTKDIYAFMIRGWAWQAFFIRPSHCRELIKWYCMASPPDEYIAAFAEIRQNYF